MTIAQSFVHLSVHSEFSITDSVVRIGDLVERAAEVGMPAVALTDRANLFGFIKFYNRCLSHGVKPIAGAELLVREPGLEQPAQATVLVMNKAGYGNLTRLVSACHARGEERGVLDREALFAAADGLIVLSGGVAGAVGHWLLAGDRARAEQAAAAYARAFPGRFYLELTRTARDGEDAYIAEAVTLADAMRLPVVATNAVRFLDEDDFEAHETRVCIATGRTLNDPRREREHSERQFLASAEEMAEAFADLPSAVANSVEIARRCNLQLALGDYYLPNYPVPEGMTLEAYLVRRSHDGLAARLEAFGDAGAAEPERYRERLQFELDVIVQMGFAGYFLIVMEFIQWAKENAIPVGPGRGSGGGSLVAYALGITDLDPLRYDLLFERFLNPERVSMPDFDVDFCMEGRDRVIAHVAERYGQDAVSQIITFGTMAAKAVVRDVARVQGKPYGLADKLSKLIPFEVGMTLTKAMKDSDELRAFVEENDEVGEIMDMAYKLEGLVRNVGKHAGGVVIAPSTLTDFVPLYADEGSGSLVTQFDKDDVETAGLVKFDFLGLKTLTIIDWAVASINASGDCGQRPITIDDIPLDDAKTYELIKAAQTTGVFQLESRGMKDLIRRLLPDNIEDIIALVALFRPGPLQSGAVDDYINRKHGREPVSYPHPNLAEALSGTYGVMLYQEQVMQIAQVLSGFTLGQADLLRRAMGKKKPEEMAKVREQFLTGARENGVNADLANQIFDQMEKFAGYAFNKSHSATYALVSFQTAWLKTHHPAHFMAANLSADMQNTDRVVTLIDEVNRMEVALTPPNVNQSEFRFSVHDGAVVYGLGAVKGVGEGPVGALVGERERGGAFRDLGDFCERVDGKRANRRVLEALIRSGAMDEFATEADDGVDAVRARLLAEVDDALQSAVQRARDEEIGMTDLFGGADPAPVRTRKVTPLAKSDRLVGEKDTLGLFLTGHPIDEHLTELGQFCSARLNDLQVRREPQVVAGLVVSSRTMRSRRGDTMGFVVLDDRSARVEASFFADAYAEHRHLLNVDSLLVVEGEVQADEFSGSQRLRVARAMTLTEARQRFADNLSIDLRGSPINGDLSERLRTLLQPHRHVREDCRGCRIAVRYEASGAEGRVMLGAEWAVRPSDELLGALRREFGPDRVALGYALR